MGRRVDSRFTRWHLAIALSLALHIGIAVVLSQSKWKATPAEAPRTPIITWLSDWKPPPTIPELNDERVPGETDTVDSQDAVPEPEVTSTSQQAESITPSSSPSQAPSAPTPTSVDWQDSLARAIEILRAEEQQTGNYLTFGFPVRSEGDPDWRYSDSRDKSTQSINERDLPPEYSSFGERILAVGDGCYQIAGSGSILAEETFRFSDYYAAPRTECPRPGPAKADLFADQKPEYLK